MFRMTCLAACLAAAPAVVMAEESHDHHDHADHVHGEGRMTVLIIDGTVTVRFESPLGDLTGDAGTEDGHAHAADAAETDHHDDDASHDLQEVRALLARSDAFVAFPAAAGCAQEALDLSMTEIEDGEHAGHADIQATWNFTCTAPADLTSLRVTALERGTGLETVAVTVVTNGRTVSADATVDAPSLRWSGAEG